MASEALFSVLRIVYRIFRENGLFRLILSSLVYTFAISCLLSVCIHTCACVWGVMFLLSARQSGGSGNTLGGTKIYFSISRGGLVPYYGCAWAYLIIFRVIIIWGLLMVSFGN